MPAIPEHDGDELSPRTLERQLNNEPLYEIGKWFDSLIFFDADKNVAF